MSKPKTPLDIQRIGNVSVASLKEVNEKVSANTVKAYQVWKTILDVLSQFEAELTEDNESASAVYQELLEWMRERDESEMLELVIGQSVFDEMLDQFDPKNPKEITVQ